MMLKSMAAMSLSCLLASAAQSAILYSDSFDVDSSAAWTVNNNNLGTNAANFQFDYSTMGIPSASGPGGTTVGLKLGANLNSATQPGTSSSIPGISVSPTGQAFSGDYELKFDWWHNYIGPLNTGASGSTMLSSFGVMTAGATTQFPGSSDGVSFAATGDGASSSDFRAYSKERPTSYQLPSSGNALDLHATYAAGGLNSSAALYGTVFPAGAVAPGTQASIASQSNSTPVGAAGFRWHDVSIKKAGDVVTWTVNGTVLVTIDASAFISTVGGGNIFFGMSDTNNTTNTNAALLEQLQFTLIDNVEVIGAVPEPASLALLGVGLIGIAAVSRRRA